MWWCAVVAKMLISTSRTINTILPANYHAGWLLAKVSGKAEGLTSQTHLGSIWLVEGVSHCKISSDNRNRNKATV